MILYNILARLLDYPVQGLKDHMDEIRTAIANEPEISDEESQAIEPFLKHLAQSELMELEKAYVQTFDMVPEHSLHLTHHLFGDDRGRGPALVDLGEHYNGMGLKAKEGELPDYLPLILEYVSTLEEIEVQIFLADAAKVLTVIAANLEKSHSRYAPLLRLVERRGLRMRMAS
ncbi:MAG: nitrate reductase molybdenum cofactor assembly chaperone [Gammaproteobacteria bacterium]|nr:nitrate reductase molybdenum cofactor assembly chaperone [Gammaproteobacteria bacterium]